MKRRVFDWKMWLLTGAFGFVGICIFAFVGSAVSNSLGTSLGYNCLHAVMFLIVPLIFAWIGMRLSLRLSRKRYAIPNNIASVRALLTALAVCILIGAAAQLVYALEERPETVVVPGDSEAVYDGTHIIMLMDCSISMQDIQGVCNEAAAALIDGLDESFSVQYIAFAKNVMDRNVSDFLPMTTANKAVINDFIGKVVAGGGTSFNAPLSRALDTLEQHRSKRYRPVILMLTDGEASVDASIASRIKSDGELSLYTVRITDDAPGTSNDNTVRDLLDLADKDFTIPNKRGKGVDVKDVLAAFRAALYRTGDSVTETRMGVGFGTDRIFEFGNTVYWWRVPAVILMFAAYGLLISYVYYNRILGGKLILNIMCGLAFAAVWLLAPYIYETKAIAVLAAYSFLHLSAITVYQIEDK